MAKNISAIIPEPIRTGRPNCAKNPLANAPATTILTRSIKVLAASRHRPSVKNGLLGGSIASISWVMVPAYHEGVSWSRGISRKMSNRLPYHQSLRRA